MAALRTQFSTHPVLSLLGSAAFLLFVGQLVFSYLVFPHYVYDQWDKQVPIPGDCVEDTSYSRSNLPPELNYPLPRMGIGTLLTSDDDRDVVALADYQAAAPHSTLLVIDKNNHAIIQRLNFDNDFVSVAIDQGILYVFNDKTLYMIDLPTGKFLKNIIETDTYRGIYLDNGMERTQWDVEISALRTDGHVLSHLHLNLRSIAFGCFISADAP